ncbi:MAG: tRNA uridine-5-carboxymethylaminomethyl(34) synthesis enzyme MnmG, partial [Pseudomonadota bacterium]
GEDRARAFHVKQSALEDARTRLAALSLTPNEAAKQGWKINQDGQRRSAWEYLAYPTIGFADLLGAFPSLADIDDHTRKQLEIEATYAGYIERQRADIAALRRDEALIIPGDIDYAGIGGLSNEVRSKLETVRPQTLGQAGRIEGVTPGALTALLAHVRRHGRKRTA